MKYGVWTEVKAGKIARIWDAELPRAMERYNRKTGQVELTGHLMKDKRTGEIVFHYSRRRQLRFKSAQEFREEFKAPLAIYGYDIKNVLPRPKRPQAKRA